MKNYGVLVPIAGHVIVEVEAGSEEEAKDLVFDVEYDPTKHDLSWDMYEKICEGNVLYVHDNEVSIEYVEE